jgi:hypothetical protein
MGERCSYHANIHIRVLAITRFQQPALRYRQKHTTTTTTTTTITNTNLPHGAESFLRSRPVFAASQEIPRNFMEPEGSLSYSQVLATRPYPEPTLSSPHDPLQHPEDPS